MDANHEARSNAAVDVSIGIAHRNNYDLLRNCVKSIVESTSSVRVEIIVVDNASTDGSAAAVADEFPVVRVLRNEEPIGYGASNNQAFAAASGEYFLVLNNDTLFTPGTLETLVARLRAEPDIGCLGCRVLNEDDSLQHSCFRRVSLWNQLFHDLAPTTLVFSKTRLRSRMLEWDHDEDRDVRVLLGAFMLFPRRVYAEIGGFDEGFKFFVEEFDICERVHAAGYRVAFTPRASIYHLGGKSFGAEPLRYYLTFQQSRERYFRKHQSALQANILRISAFAGIFLRLVGWTLAGILMGSRRARAKSMVDVYRRALPKLLPLSSTWTEANQAQHSAEK